MKLKNKTGKERNFKVLFKIEKKNKEYIIYEDINTLNLYGGRLEENILKPLNEKEYEMLNMMLERLVGE